MPASPSAQPIAGHLLDSLLQIGGKVQQPTGPQQATQSVPRVRSQTALASNDPTMQPPESSLHELLHVSGREPATVQQLRAMQPKIRSRPLAAQNISSPASPLAENVLPDSCVNISSKEQHTAAAVQARLCAAQTPASFSARPEACHSPGSLCIGREKQTTTGVQQVQAKRSRTKARALAAQLTASPTAPSHLLCDILHISSQVSGSTRDDDASDDSSPSTSAAQDERHQHDLASAQHMAGDWRQQQPKSAHSSRNRVPVRGHYSPFNAADGQHTKEKCCRKS